MAEVRPFRGLRYDAAVVDPAQTIAPPYDVISEGEQAALYDRSPYNIVRVEFGLQRADDGPSSNRYTRAAAELADWRRAAVLLSESKPAIYHHRLTFEWESRRYERAHYLALVRLEEWEKGVVKPHEYTLSGPKADRLELLRAARTQVSPVYCLYRERGPRADGVPSGEAIYDFSVDAQHHVVTAITDESALSGLARLFDASDFYIADGHHRYETALAYRNERQAASTSWTGEEKESFVLMAMTAVEDPGLLVLPTHRVVHRPVASNALARLRATFVVTEVRDESEKLVREQALAKAGKDGVSAFIAIGLEPGRAHLLQLRDRSAVERTMPASQAEAWKRLDVNVLQFGILNAVFGIDDAALAAGGSVSYVQDGDEAIRAVHAGQATCAFLLAATPVEQIVAVSDANGRMPQKSTYFYPKLPTGLVLNPLD